jgi:hypothetical protein
MQHDASREAPPTFIIEAHAKDKHGGQPRPCFVGFSWRHVRQGSMEVTQSKVGDSIRQAKEWMRAFGRSNPMEHVVTKQQRSMECIEERWS